jgi:hypothetical protein
MRLYPDRHEGGHGPLAALTINASPAPGLSFVAGALAWRVAPLGAVS